jgi:hypothetical protein
MAYKNKKYGHTKFFENTVLKLLFIAAQSFRVSSIFDLYFIYITAQSIFAVEPSAWVRWKGISIDNFA